MKAKNLKQLDVYSLPGVEKWRIAVRTLKWTNTIIMIDYCDEAMPTSNGNLITHSHQIDIDGEVTIAGKSKSAAIREAYQTALSMLTPPYTSIISGSDPEVFVVDGAGEVIPAWKFLSSKTKPSEGLQLSNGRNNIYWDGFQAEFDTTPSGCLAYHCDSVQRGLAGVLRYAKEFDKNAKISHKSAFIIKKEDIESASDEHVQFGCMPSQNAYGLIGSKLDGRETQFRFAGGHIHLGMNIQSKDHADSIVRSMDAIVGVACVSLFADIDSPARRQFYGLAGEYRTPKHGIEYRTLSNAWLIHPLVMNLVFELARKSAAHGSHRMSAWKAKEQDVLDAIQNCDVDLSRKILQDNKAYLRVLLNHLVSKDEYMFFDLFSNGVDKFIKNVEDVEGNWRLSTPRSWLDHCEGPNMNISKFSQKQGKARV